MPRSSRNNFTSGVFDPKLASRSDLQQYPAALREGTNFMLDPHGGAFRRPGTRKVVEFSEAGRLMRFKFNRKQQYAIQLRDEALDIYEKEVRITSVVTPWASEELDRLYTKAQLADTAVIFHDNHDDVIIAPHRLLRGALRALSPIRVFDGSDIVRVYHPGHEALDLDQIGISGVRREIALGSNPLSVLSSGAGTSIMQVVVPSGHGFSAGDYFYLSGLLSIPSLLDSNINTRQLVTVADATHLTFVIPDAGVVTAGFGGSGGILYAKDIGGLDIDTAINTSHTARTVESNQTIAGGHLREIPAMGTDPVKILTPLSGPIPVVEVDLGYDAGLISDDDDPETADYITLKGLTAVGGVPPEQLNATHRVLFTSGTKITVAVATSGTIGVEGGGSGGSWKAANFYEFQASSAADIAPDSTLVTGGDAARSWLLHSLAPNKDRRVAFKNLPRFDYDDYLSPAPAKEVQELVFGSFLTGDSYILLVDVPSLGRAFRGQVQAATTIRTPFLAYDSGHKENNAQIIQDAINSGFSGYYTSGSNLVTVVYEGTDLSGKPAGDCYRIEFSDALDYGEIQVFKIRSTSGVIYPDTRVEGGSTEEDVMSDTRGWAAGGIFYQRRLLMWGMASRPSTILGSRQEFFFDFDIGSALPSDAIDATGAFDPVLHLIDSRGLFALTDGGEVLISGGDGKSALEPGTIEFETANTYGATAATPVSLAGRPIYIDRIARNVRQLGYSQDSNAVESKEISILSQHLVKSPVQLEVWRNSYGDYAFARNPDGTFAVLNLNVEQGVAGWTPWTTKGKFVDMMECDDKLYVTVERTINGTKRWFFEAFDFAYYTDCSLSYEDQIALGEILYFSTGLRDDLPGYDYLEGETVQVRAGSATMEPQEVVGGVVAPKSADAIVRSTRVIAGLAIPEPALEPMPPQIGLFTSVVSATVDWYESRDRFVNGFQMYPYAPGQAVEAHSAPPLFTGFEEAIVIGWGDRESVRITAPNPQPCFVRAIHMEVV